MTLFLKAHRKTVLITGLVLLANAGWWLYARSRSHLPHEHAGYGDLVSLPQDLVAVDGTS